MTGNIALLPHVNWCGTILSVPSKDTNFNQHKFAQTDGQMTFICRSYGCQTEAAVSRCCSVALKRSLLLLWFSFGGSVTFVFVPSVVQVLCWSWQKARMWQKSAGLFRGEFSCRRGNAKFVSLCVAFSSCTNYSVSCGKIFHVFLSSVKPCGSLDHLRWTTETWTTFYKQQQTQQEACFWCDSLLNSDTPF